jgi:hypothetical protein
MKLLLSLLIPATFVFQACNNSKSPAASTEKKVAASSAVKKADDDHIAWSEVKNNVGMSVEGDIKITKAWLSHEDGTVISDENTVGLGEKAILHLDIDGWKEDAGKVYLGASEDIKTNNGTEVIKADDIFSGYDATGIDPADAKLITLSAVITNQTGSIDYFVVSYKVWDKRSSSSVTGSYKMYIK